MALYEAKGMRKSLVPSPVVELSMAIVGVLSISASVVFLTGIVPFSFSPVLGALVLSIGVGLLIASVASAVLVSREIKRERYWRSQVMKWDDLFMDCHSHCSSMLSINQNARVIPKKTLGEKRVVSSATSRRSSPKLYSSSLNQEEYLSCLSDSSDDN
ncbi:hypothetical protein CP10139811_0233 [Chlamydia ibidis]|uniref:Uncharacterized protein n=3 Tax=Chlamydia ibidis TaxID=1405396 RepID=S7KDN9_9CHLA|nr:hypothetical protein CP10139811_0233 [Chlamydia ibidis]